MRERRESGKKINLENFNNDRAYHLTLRKNALFKNCELWQKFQKQQQQWLRASKKKAQRRKILSDVNTFTARNRWRNVDQKESETVRKNGTSLKVTKCAAVVYLLSAERKKKQSPG